MAEHHDITYRPIHQLRRTKGLHKLMHNRLSLPLDFAETAIKRLKFAWNPAQMRQRTRLAGTLQHTCGDEFLAQNGYLHIKPADVNGLQDALDECTQALQSSTSTGAIKTAQAAAPKEFLISIIKDEQLLAHKALTGFAVSHPLIELAARYFGAVPMLSGVRLWWTPPNKTVIGSQLFHCDREDRRQLKFLINVMASTPESGPFTLISAGQSARIKSAVRYSYKTYQLTDGEICAAGEPDELIALTGPPGSIACVDTSRCLHYGSRNNTQPRLLLMIQFTDCLAPNVTLPKWHLGLSKLGLELDALQRLALGVTLA